MTSFDQIAEASRRGDRAAAVERLLSELRGGDDHAALFQGLLLAARVRLG
jgi:hypothetical protein